MLRYFHGGKTAADAQSLICEECGEDIVSLSTCEVWYNRFKSDKSDGCEDVSNHKIKIDELKTLLEKDPYLSQRKLAQQLGVTHSSVWKYLKKIEEEAETQEVDRQVE
ncbi:hypothetical protein DMN91_006390 [Ooceraea biroi]|uniref:Mos1 transposase HTH domain-containing protein n=1 Tax=Ooceraea biroi TaxID=2015173 RepID=A0A3L8DNP3_OOCBI|nr:hypothetical protein DMN91_006390 [Ooceraea biroi]